jgi:hypothetical protein
MRIVSDDAALGDVGDVQVARPVGHNAISISANLAEVDDFRGYRLGARFGITQDFGWSENAFRPVVTVQ